MIHNLGVHIIYSILYFIYLYTHLVLSVRLSVDLFVCLSQPVGGLTNQLNEMTLCRVVVSTSVNISLRRDISDKSMGHVSLQFDQPYFIFVRQRGSIAASLSLNLEHICSSPMDNYMRSARAPENLGIHS